MKDKILYIINKYPSLLRKYEINTKLRKAHFFAQMYHESQLIPKSENLNYSAKRMLEVFKSDFDTNRDKWLSPQEKNKVLSLVGSPERIANFVYANQNGNGNEASGDGWKYRGRGLIQLTGRALYEKLSKATGIDFVNNPDLLLDETNSLIAALWYWNGIKGNTLADQDNIKAITIAINGGLNGFDDRKRLLESCKQIFT